MCSSASPVYSMLHSLVSFIVMLEEYSFDAHLFERCGLLVLFMVGTAENPWFLSDCTHCCTRVAGHVSFTELCSPDDAD